MAGIVKQAKKSGERLLLRPSDGPEWEAWAIGEGAQPRLVEMRATPGEGRNAQQTVLGLPLRQLFAVPLWLATTDPALMREMIFLQLERRGLAAGRSAREIVYDYRVVASLENKTLVLAVALPASLPAHLCIDARGFEPSARLLPLPPDGFALWREDGRLALAVTRGTELAYFQVLGDGNFTEAVLRELQCIKLQLEAANTIQRAVSITVWGEFSAAEIFALGQALGLGIATGGRPAPVLPAERMDLVPASIRQIREAMKIRRRNASLAAAAVGVYFLLVLALVLRVTWFYVTSGRIEAGLAAHESEVSDIEATAARWDALSPAIDPESYPVELLLRCSNLLPPDGVRFTLFETNEGKILIQGEAADAKAAFNFADALKQSRDLRDYKIEMPLPATLPNGNTKFQIQGTRYGAPAH